MHKYDIRDVWLGLKIASKNFFIAAPTVWFGGIFILSIIMNAEEYESFFNKFGMQYFLGTVGIIFIQSIIIYLANRRYIVDMETGLITFPRSDMENSILAIILLFPYWNLMRTKIIQSSEIENIYIDTKRWSTKYQKYAGTTSTGKSKYRSETKKHARYTINIAGTFGSANLQFLDRQKRDEVRNAIQQSVKQYTGKNVDRKVSEFS